MQGDDTCRRVLRPVKESVEKNKIGKCRRSRQVAVGTRFPLHVLVYA